LEAGVWRGGATILMKGCLQAYGMEGTKVFVADSFEGLPKPNAPEYPKDRGGGHHTYDFLSVSEEEVKFNFKNYNLIDDSIVFLKGWFKDTLTDPTIQHLSLLRADGDMYESTHDILNNLYPKLSKGGFCVIDDYCLESCRKAVTDYRKKHGVNEPIFSIDSIATYWRKDS